MTPLNDKIAQFKKTLAWFDESSMTPDYKGLCHDAMKIMDRCESEFLERAIEIIRDYKPNTNLQEQYGMGLAITALRKEFKGGANGERPVSQRT